MNAGRDATRRNRNIGTVKQGHGQDNRLVIPECAPFAKAYWEKLANYRLASRMIHSRAMSFVVEQTRPDTCHACTVDDLARVLNQVPSTALDDIEFILLRQPKRKEELLNPVWGRIDWFAEVGELHGRAIILDALTLAKPIRWSTSLSPYLETEIERLRRDGHKIDRTKRNHLIHLSLAAVRATQLYRTLLHEIGHNVDRNRDPQAFAHKTSHDKEAFAHQYAAELRARLEHFGVLPFDRMLDSAALAKDGLALSDFTLKAG